MDDIYGYYDYIADDNLAYEQPYYPPSDDNLAYTSSGGYNDWDDFEQDWADVTSGRYTLDEIAAGDDVQDLYYASFDNPAIVDSIGGFVKKYGKEAFNAIKSAFEKPDGKTDWKKVAGAVGGIAGAVGLGSLTQAQDSGPKGYQGGIPSYSLVRERVQDTYDPTRRAGSGGRRYFSDVTYSPAAGVEAARTAAQEQAAGLAALNTSNPANQRVATTQQQAPVQATSEQTADRPASAVIEDLPVPTYNQGGIAALKEGKYLRGATDGMSDELRTTIDGKQPAALSHGEFVVPADVVSHLGNGNSDAGAKKLYEMMDRIRKARTGTTKQGREINPNKFLPKAR